MRYTDAWPIWDGAERLDGRRVRLDYPNGTAYAVGNAVHRGNNHGYYVLDGTDIWFGSISTRVHVAPVGER